MIIIIYTILLYSQTLYLVFVIERSQSCFIIHPFVPACFPHLLSCLSTPCCALQSIALSCLISLPEQTEAEPGVFFKIIFWSESCSLLQLSPADQYHLVSFNYILFVQHKFITNFKCIICLIRGQTLHVQMLLWCLRTSWYNLQPLSTCTTNK